MLQISLALIRHRQYKMVCPNGAIKLWMQLPRARSAAVSTRPAARFDPASGCHRREPTRPEPRSFSVTKVGAPERAPDLNCSFPRVAIDNALRFVELAGKACQFTCSMVLDFLKCLLYHSGNMRGGENETEVRKQHRKHSQP